MLTKSMKYDFLYKIVAVIDGNRNFISQTCLS